MLLARRIEPRIVDRTLCVAFAGLAVIDLLTGTASGDAPAVTALGIAVLVLLPLARRRAPIAAILAWSGVVICLTAIDADPYEMTTAFVGLFVYPYAAGAYADGPRVLLAIPAVWGALTVMSVAADEFVAGDIFFPSTFGMLFLLAGRAVRSRSRLTAELHEAAVRADEVRET
jgi:MYXO-CTERM domain-containing protein